MPSGTRLGTVAGIIAIFLFLRGNLAVAACDGQGHCFTPHYESHPIGPGGSGNSSTGSSSSSSSSSGGSGTSHYHPVFRGNNAPNYTNNPSHTTNGDPVAVKLNERGNEFLKARDYHAAADYYRVAIHRDPYNNLYICDYFLAVARIAYGNDELHNAIEYLHAAMQYYQLDLGWQKLYSEWLTKQSRVQAGKEVLTGGDGQCKAPGWCSGPKGQLLAWIWMQSPEEELYQIRFVHVGYQHSELRQFVN